MDDEQSYTELLPRILADNLGCPVHAFSRPLEALQVLSSLYPGVVVTDDSMPQLNGREFIRQATLLVPDAAFVMITGNNLSAEEDPLARLTVLKGVLAKPFSWGTLADETLRVWPGHLTPPGRPAGAASR